MILVTNKYLLPNFKYPICLTSLHMAASTLFANVAVSLFRVAPPAQLQSASHGMRVFVLALSFSVSIVFGQMVGARVVGASTIIVSIWLDSG